MSSTKVPPRLANILRDAASKTDDLYRLADVTAYQTLIDKLEDGDDSIKVKDYNDKDANDLIKVKDANDLIKVKDANDLIKVKDANDLIKVRENKARHELYCYFMCVHDKLQSQV